MDVAEELLDVDGKVDRAYVERRLEDWYRRLDRLYADVDRWLPDRWSTADGGKMRIYEDMMQRFDIPAQYFPIRTLLREQKPAGRLEPRGLWIIGANGRIDLILADDHYLIIDRVDSFAPSNWKVARLTNRREQQSFDRSFLLRVLH